jgi:hypothetical protein
LVTNFALTIRNPTCAGIWYLNYFGGYNSDLLLGGQNFGVLAIELKLGLELCIRD